MLFAFAPFLVFAVLDHLAGATVGLIGGALVSAVLLLRDWMAPGRSPKVLEIGSVILFGGLAAYALASGASWSIIGVRLGVDLGLLLIVLTSMAIGKPFTIQYARERVDPALWQHPEFIRTNYVITAVWALAFLVLVAADIVMLYVPELPTHFGVIATILAIVAAVKFTAWYPARRKANRTA